MASRKSTRKHSKRPAKRKKAAPRVLSAGPAFARLVAVMARLRAPGGCPWDREQTHATLRTYLIEEVYEVLEALDSTDDAKFAEELGDLLLQVLFHAQIANEAGRFDITDVIREIYEKMIRRHPHVFGKKRAKDAAEVLHNWEIIKQEERRSKKTVSTRVSFLGAASLGAGFDLALSSNSSSEAGHPPDSLLDGVPRTLPALLEGLQLTRKAARIGFDWHNVDGIFDKFDEEFTELRHALAKKESPSRIESEVGDILFVAVNLARHLNIDPELAMKKANSKFSRRFREMERLARQQGTTLAEIPRTHMESLWDRSKLFDQPEKV
jgi:tetrapyrrole methylase family protein / MazG family protein